MPSFLPCPVTLPGRVMSNAKLHIKEGESNTPEFDMYSKLFVYLNMLLATIELVVSLPVVFLLGIATATLGILLAPFAVAAIFIDDFVANALDSKHFLPEVLHLGFDLLVDFISTSIQKNKLKILADTNSFDDDDSDDGYEDTYNSDSDYDSSEDLDSDYDSSEDSDDELIYRF